MSLIIENMVRDLNLADKEYIVAVGNSYLDGLRVCESYQEALKVLQQRLGISQGIFYFEKEILNVFLNEASDYYKSSFVTNLFKSCTENEVAEFCDFINIYFKHNGSISAIAKELFVHKNTVQYRIDKIAKKTGYDLRAIEDAIFLKIATVWTNCSRIL